MLPRNVMMISGMICLSSLKLSALRYAPVDATVPGHNATVLVALALMEGMPVTSSAGKAMNPPPPATEFTAPPRTAAPKSKTVSAGLTEYCSNRWRSFCRALRYFAFLDAIKFDDEDT